MTFGSKCREDIKDLFLTEQDLINQSIRSRLFSVGNGGPYGANTSSWTQVGSCVTWKKMYSTTYGTSCNVGLIDENDTLYIMGCNSAGTIGDNTTAAKSVPTAVCSGTDFREISFGECHVIGVKNNGSLWGWGINNCYQSVPSGSTFGSYNTPQQIYSSGWKKVGTGRSSSFAIAANNDMYVWGSNIRGELGANSTSSPVQPCCIGNTYICASGGIEFTIFLKNDYTMWASGSNCSGSLGIGCANTFGVGVFFTSSPIQITSPSKKWKHISATCRGVAAITVEGELWTWGDNSLCGLGVINAGGTVSCPVLVGPQWRCVCLSPRGGIGVRTDGYLYVWGNQTTTAAFLGINAALTCCIVTPEPVGNMPLVKSVATNCLRNHFLSALNTLGED